MKKNIDVLKTVLVAADEYEMKFGKHPVLFINESFYGALINEKEIRRDHLMMIWPRNVALCGYPVKLVPDGSDEMHFWVGEEKTIYEEEN